MTLFYGLLSPWLVSSFAAFGVMASVFVALVWLRIVFLAMAYGAAMASHRYRDSGQGDGGAASGTSLQAAAPDSGRQPPGTTGAGP